MELSALDASDQRQRLSPLRPPELLLSFRVLTPVASYSAKLMCGADTGLRARQGVSVSKIQPVDGISWHHHRPVPNSDGRTRRLTPQTRSRGQSMCKAAPSLPQPPLRQQRTSCLTLPVPPSSRPLRLPLKHPRTPFLGGDRSSMPRRASRATAACTRRQSASEARCTTLASSCASTSPRSVRACQ